MLRSLRPGRTGKRCKPLHIPANAIPLPSPTGYSNAFTDLFKNNSPDYAVGINLTIPLRNRGAQADQIRSQLEYRQAQLHLQQLQNQIGSKCATPNLP